MKDKIYVDELVIGAGLSGLMYGLVAVDEHYKVAITESYAKPGGYATSFTRDKRKYIFDCSQHKITGLGDNGNLRDALQRAGVWDLLDIRFYKELTTLIYKGEFTVFPTEATAIKKMLLNKFPGEVAGINHLFKDIVTHGYQYYMFGRMMLGEYVLDKELLPESRRLAGITAKQYFKQLFHNKEIIEFLSAIAIYLGTLANESNAFYFLHFLYTAFYTRQGYIQGTGYDLTLVLANEFKRRGGKLILNNTAFKIHVNDVNKVSHVETRKRQIITNSVVATCSASMVINLIESGKVSAAFSKKVNALTTGWGHFCVYIVCARPPEELGFESSEYLLVADEGDDCYDDDFKNEAYYNKLTLSITNYHQIYEAGGPILQLIILDYESDWFTLSAEKYMEKKNRIQQKLLNRVYTHFPKLNGQLKYTEASTPRTNYAYTLSENGSAFGYKVLPKTNLGFLNKFPVNGIKLMSSWTAGPGYEAAMCLGFTHAMLQKNNLQHIT